MRRSVRVNLGSLILSLSDAMDLASPFLIQHQQRTAFIVWKMGTAAGLPQKKLEDVFIAALIHDIGAFSLEEKVQLRNAESISPEDHCLRGQLLLDPIPWLSNSGSIIRFHHTEWQSWQESIDSAVVFKSQMLALADCLERLIRRNVFILHQHEQIAQKIRSMTGSSFHPRVVELFDLVSQTEEFWLDLVSPRLYSILLNEGPLKKSEIEFRELSIVAEFFRNIIDFRSRFTSTHSSGVAASAAMLARIFGLTDAEVRLMGVAGNLHDLGKLAIPNSILDKPGKLNDEEMLVMKSHTYYTYSIISSIGGLHSIAEWAGYHHEKIDGSGYPFRCTAAELSTGARIMAVADIFTALAEDRPYRKGMNKKEIVSILKDMSDRSLLDTRIVRMLFENYEIVHADMAKQQATAMNFYESQFAEQSHPL